MSQKRGKKVHQDPPAGFPSQLKRMRERYGMSRELLGECCGLSRDIIRKYESGERSPKMESVVKIADFFEVSTDHLIGRRGF